jgi:site-specific recombinase XerD
MTLSTALTIANNADQITVLIERVIAGRSSVGTKKKYKERLKGFFIWLNTSNSTKLDEETLGKYKEHLAANHLSASTINGHLVAIRALVRKAADLDLIDERTAERIASVESVAEKGERAGNWLSKAEAQALLDACDTNTLKGKRDLAILGVLLFCGLRRAELASLTIGHLQQREGHNVIADMLGKGGRVRTIKVPVGLKAVIDAWLTASRRTLNNDSLVFVAMRKGDHLAEGETISTQALYKLTKEYGALIGHPELAPHDIRRTFAKLANRGGAALQDISMTLGHASLVTTQRYLGLDLNLESGAPDRVGLKITSAAER